jgi:hypothetical protein
MEIKYCLIGKCGCKNLDAHKFDFMGCDPPQEELGIFIDQYRTCPWPERQRRIDLSPKEIVDQVNWMRGEWKKRHADKEAR